MNPLRIAVLGAGMIGRRHIETILKRPDLAVLAGVADPAARAEDWPATDAPFVADPKALLDTLQPHAVIIATPNQLHLTHGLLCCERRLPFLIEKPVTATWDDAVSLVQAVRTAGIGTLVGHHRRYLAPVRAAKQRLGEGAIGDIVAASVVWATRKPEPYFNVAWRRTAGGGPLLINAIHEVDMLRHLCGEVVQVQGVKSHARRQFPVEDTAAAILVFESGCVATLVCTDAGLSPWTIEQGSQENSLFGFTHESAYRIVGSLGSLELPVLRQWNARTPGQEAWDRPLTAQYLGGGWEDPYEAQLAHLQRVVRLGEAPIISVEDGARTLAATLAIAQAAEGGAGIRPAAI